MQKNNITGSMIQSYLICRRQVWLMSHNISCDEENENLVIGKLISENSYKSKAKEVKIGNMSFDTYRKEDDKIIVGEIKKSSKAIESAKYQLLYYLKELEEIGINAEGEIIIPTEKKKIPIQLTGQNREELENIEKDIFSIIYKELPPKIESEKFCKGCSYCQYCFS